MASRTSGRGEERSGGRNASGASDNTTRRQSTTAQGAAESARQSATNSPRQNATSSAGQSSGQRQSATQNQNATQTANRTQSQNPDVQRQQARGSSGGNESERGGDRERELRTSREQGNMRPAASAQRGNVGRETGGSGTSSSSAGANPFALMRRMMEDMDRIFSDFGFTTPGMFGSSLLNPDLSRSSSQRSLGGGTSGGSSLAGTQRGQQSLARSGQGSGLQPRSFGSLWSPQVEVFERGKDLVVRADLPGLSREDVDVELDDDALIIRGERQSDVEDEDDGFYRTERSYGSFYRAIPLPEGIEASGCNATFKDGVLEVTLPKPQQQPSRARRIDVRGA